MKRTFRIIGAICLAFALSIAFTSAAADFIVNSFSCTPSEVVINDVFSCTAQLKNNGGDAGSVSTATLYPDDNDWLASSSYAQASGVSVNPGQTTEVTFSGLRAVKSGNNGFSQITLDSVTDTRVATEYNTKVNVIDVIVTVSNSASSAAMGGNITSSAQVTAGGSIDVTLTLSISSGGCNIGSQSSSVSLADMTDGSSQSRTWTVTEGSSGSCVFTISAAATGDGGVASKTDSTSSTITCSDCPSSSSSSSSGSSGGAGSGGGAGLTTTVELTTAVSKELSHGETFKFSFGKENHSLSLTGLTETEATIKIKSEEQVFTLKVNEEKMVDFENDAKNDISIILKSINKTANKAVFVITPLYIPETPSKAGSESEEAGSGIGAGIGKIGEGIANIGEKIGGKWVWIVIVIGVVIVAGIAAAILLRKKHREANLRHSVKIRYGFVFNLLQI